MFDGVSADIIRQKGGLFRELDKLRIAILASGSRGDVQPFVALGVGLSRAGYDVVIAAPHHFASFVGENQLSFFPLAADIQQMLESDEGRRLLESGGNPIKVFRQLARMIEPVAVRMLGELREVCQNADAIVAASGLLFAVESLVEEHPRSVIYGSLQPMAPTNQQPSMMLPPLPKPLRLLGRLGYHWLTHVFSLQIFWQMFRGPVNRARQEILSLPPRSRWLPLNTFHSGRMFLYCYSDAVVPRPTDWSANNLVTGYWFLDHPDEWQPPPGLVEFLNAGTAPVYVGFGSMHEQNASEVTELVLGALQQTKQRGILLTGWRGLDGAVRSGDVFVVDAVPHDWLFPRMTAVVHHGGAGTTAAGLRAGTPSVIIPYMADQPFWGRRVYELGVGPKPIPRQRLNAERLARAIAIAVSDVKMQRRAAELGGRIRSDDGVGCAVDAIERLLQNRRGG